MQDFRNHSDENSNLPNIIVNPGRVKSSLYNLLMTEKYIQLPNGEKIEVQEIMNKLKNICCIIIKKYGLSVDDGKNFIKGINIFPFEGDPECPSYRGSALSGVSYPNLLPFCKIYINPELSYNRNLYFAAMFHELDHHAFYFKKFIDRHINSIPSVQGIKDALYLFTQESINDDTFSFGTELLARVDTADNLMENGIPWNQVWEYGPGNDRLTTGETVYTDSIKYAKKFLQFQIGFYNLLLANFGLDSSKPKNNQLQEVADKHFQTIMNRLRNEIFNSPSIERSKNVIDESYRKLQESGGSWNTFCSLRK